MSAWEELLTADDVTHDIDVEQTILVTRLLSAGAAVIRSTDTRSPNISCTWPSTKWKTANPGTSWITTRIEKMVDQTMDSWNPLCYAEEIIRRRGPTIPPPPTDSLEPFEHRVQTAVYGLRGQGCAENIAPYVSAMAGVQVLPAPVSSGLHRLLIP